MSDVILRVDGLGKRYRLNHPGRRRGGQNLREKIAENFAALGRRMMGNSTPDDDPQHEDFWALREVSLEIRRGQAIGIIGRNGAGKSTLLKLVSRITAPTEGRIEIRGRVASLLEVGTGFHPELTGRENIFLNGAILGMTRGEIRRKFDEIVAFAEIERFLDTPVKRYSSGMYVRLAFAVAAHLDPEILIVDEVLAVGDAAFQRKCLARMNDASHEGRTVIVVSHNMLAVEGLCSHAIWLDRGQVVGSGDVRQVIAGYMHESSSPINQRSWNDPSMAPGNDHVRMAAARLKPEGDAASPELSVVRPFRMEFDFWNLLPDAYLNAGIQLFNEQGVLVFESKPIETTAWLGKPFPAGVFRYVCHVPGNLLNSGTYRVAFWIDRNNDLLHREDDILVFEILDSAEKRAGVYGRWEGIVRPILKWDTELLPADA